MHQVHIITKKIRFFFIIVVFSLLYACNPPQGAECFMGGGGKAEPFTRNKPCAIGSTCVNQKCIVEYSGLAGQDCRDAPNLICKSGLICNSASFKCALPGETGAVCAEFPSLNKDCGAGLICNSAYDGLQHETQTTNKSDYGICSKPQNIDGKCNRTEHCATGLVCIEKGNAKICDKPLN